MKLYKTKQLVWMNVKLFNIKISNGPIYVCTVCLQTWFRRSVYNIEFIKVSSEAEEEKLNQCKDIMSL